ncbi:MAG: LEA type 2 family protein [Chloroflexi bacterium]|nr:LEA type 2 family protein [Chloroflexota bacterium]
MRERLLVITLLVLVAFVFLGCAPAAPATTEVKAPTVKLTRVEVSSYFPVPWKEWPAQPPTPTPQIPVAVRVPMNLAFVYEIENPNDVAVTLDQMKFTVELEAAPSSPGDYFALATPNVYDRQSIPAKTTNALRVNVVIDSAVVPGTLLVAYGQRIAEKKLNPNALVSSWWDQIQDFKYGIKVTGGTADFSGGGKRTLATFEGKWPK